MVTAGIVGVLLSYKWARLALILPVVFAVTGFIFSGISSLIATISLPPIIIAIAKYFHVHYAFYAFLFFVQARIMWKSLDKWLQMI